jgi:putative transposase
MAVMKLHLPKRKIQRLKNYDYSQNGYYFITICTHNRQYLFGEIMDGQMVLNEYGKIVQQELLQIPVRFFNVVLDKFVVMPNHIHIIIAIVGNGLDHSVNDQGTDNRNTYQNIDNRNTYQNIDNRNTQTERSRPFPTIPKILGLYKSGAARIIHKMDMKIIVWQKSYHDHIIRTDAEYQKIWEYIDTNHLKWQEDKYFA